MVNKVSEPKTFESLYPIETRKRELAKIIEFVSVGKSCQVVGLPGTGKNNVLRLLPYSREVREYHLAAKEPSCHFVYMDFSEVSKRPLTDIMKFILISLAASFRERKLPEEEAAVNKFLEDALRVSDEMYFSQSLKKAIEYLANEKELSVIFLFDRFETYIPNIDSQFFLNLKILRNVAKYRFAAVFATTRPIEDILEPQIYLEFSEFFSGNIIYLSVMDRVGLDFRLQHLEEIVGKKLDIKTREEIIKLSGGHGKITRISCEAFLASENIPQNLEEFLLLNTRVKQALWEIWNFLTSEEQRSITRNVKCELLEKIGLTRDGKITIPLFETYISTLALSGVERQKLIFDAQRNEIFKGEQNITELLSPQEFRLLRYLLQNQDRVCEKDEIITNVWKESKTVSGVTDQALDQIIYRLRKKIEDDPENPHFIHTIKGRGYKLSS